MKRYAKGLSVSMIGPSTHLVKYRGFYLNPGVALAKINQNDAQGGAMIPIESSKLEQIEYLLAQSAQGIHLLFDREALTKILAQPTDEKDFFSFENLNRIQEILTQFIARPSFQGKLEYLGTLDAENFELLVRTYFHIVDSTVLASHRFKH
jgi:hypothetical protein